MKEHRSKMIRVKPSAVAKKASSSVDKSFRSSMFYNFFRSHRLSEERFSNGIFGKLLSSVSIYTSAKTFKNSFAQKTETSFIVTFLRDFYERMLLCNFRNYASVLFYFSIYAFAVSASGYTFDRSSVSGVGDIYSSLILLVVSLILMPLKGSLKDIVSRSKILSRMADLFFMPVSFSERSASYIPGTHNAGVMLIGTSLGLLTAFVPIKSILAAAAFAFLVLSFFKTPENSLPVIIVFTMFATAQQLCILCIVAFFAYFFKVLRGKRSFDLKYFDVLYLLFAFVIIMAGFNTTKSGFSDRYTLRIVSYVSVYFIFRNCVRNDKASKKIINTAVLCGMISALTILYSRFCAWGYTDIVREYTGIAFKAPLVDVFSLCGFLLIIFPFVLSSLASSKYNRGKLFTLITVFLSAAALLSTGSKGFIIGVAVCVLIYVVSSFKNPFTSLLTVVVVYVIISVAITNAPFLGSDRFLSVSDYTKSMTVTTTQIISDNFVSGIGFGTDNFSSVFSAYTHFSDNAVMYSNNVFLHTLACFGVFGSIFMLVLFVNYYKMQFTSISENRSKNLVSSVVSISSIASVSTVLLRGFTDYPLSNPRVSLMLFVIIGFSAAVYYRGSNDFDVLFEE
ncbi:MAG: hypothetical protein E7656_00515 [Ruminococcaceae bacterium]|nr:hypothetical protein [Oscillospiraceae bacterium]